MAYVVLARKYRSAQFSDIVGQGPVVRTLMNAIANDRVHHAYLLTGSRGIGKTSIARILAKALRCENSTVVDGWLETCGVCANCREIAAGNSVDVIEIDGASNNGVDAVREIRENAKYLPSSGRRKIYIIDEVHMLTTAAFNALLKTLEEPPPHVVFILATTEVHKIPGTILSRCQRFDLKRITVPQIHARLVEIAKNENISVESSAVALLARAADGSMRDALSLFDQVISYSGDTVTAAGVRESVGLIGSQTILGILRAIFMRQPIDALKLIDDAYQAGHDLKLLNRSLIEYLHAAVLVKIQAPHSGLIELNEEEWKELESFSAHRELEEIELFFQAMQTATDWIGRSPQPKIVLEVVVIKCATAEALIRVGDPSGSTGTGSPQKSTAAAPASGATKSSAPATSAAPAPSAGVKTSAAPSPSAPALAPSPTRTSTAAPVAPTPAPSPAPSSGAKLFQKAPAKTSASETIAFPDYEGPRNWETFLGFIRAKRPLLASVLENANCENFPSEANEEFVIAFGPSDAYFKEQLGSKAYLDQLATITTQYFGKMKRLTIEVRDGVVSVSQKRAADQETLEASIRQRAADHPVIKEARSLFGGDLGPVEILNPQDEGGSGARSS